MKVYVRGFVVKPDFKDAVKAGKAVPADCYDIYYDGDPRHWQFLDPQMGEAELRTLQSMHIHVESHYCRLELEEFQPGTFAIVCPDHPPRRNPPA
jgi:hypothetical protein